MKQGFKSTEFWLNLVGMVSGIVLAAMGDNQWTTLAGSVLSAICGASYSLGRSMIKSTETTAAARVTTAQLLRGKKS